MARAVDEGHVIGRGADGGARVVRGGEVVEAAPRLGAMRVPRGPPVSGKVPVAGSGGPAKPQVAAYWLTVPPWRHIVPSRNGMERLGESQCEQRW